MQRRALPTRGPKGFRGALAPKSRPCRAAAAGSELVGSHMELGVCWCMRSCFPVFLACKARGCMHKSVQQYDLLCAVWGSFWAVPVDGHVDESVHCAHEPAAAQAGSPREGGLREAAPKPRGLGPSLGGSRAGHRGEQFVTPGGGPEDEWHKGSQETTKCQLGRSGWTWGQLCSQVMSICSSMQRCPRTNSRGGSRMQSTSEAVCRHALGGRLATAVADMLSVVVASSGQRPSRWQLHTVNRCKVAIRARVKTTPAPFVERRADIVQKLFPTRVPSHLPESREYHEHAMRHARPNAPPATGTGPSCPPSGASPRPEPDRPRRGLRGYRGDVTGRGGGGSVKAFVRRHDGTRASSFCL